MLIKNNGIYAYQHKRGDTFEFSGVIDVKHQGKIVPDLTGWAGKSQLRKQSGELIADLVFTWIDAAQIMCIGMLDGWFTGKKFGDYFTAQKTDWVNARRIINGTDKADTIAGYARAFYSALGGA